jgi:type IV pilus assembly protein PilV
MVAATILTIGLLALSGMQAMSLKKNVGANELTRVSNLAADMVERIQFNRRNVTAYHNINVSAGATTCPATTVNVMANGDCTQWRTLLLGSGLANVVGTVTLNPVPPTVDVLGLTRSTVTVRLDWLANSNAGTAASMTKSTTLVTVVAPE